MQNGNFTKEEEVLQKAQELFGVNTAQGTGQPVGAQKEVSENVEKPQAQIENSPNSKGSDQAASKAEQGSRMSQGLLADIRNGVTLKPAAERNLAEVAPGKQVDITAKLRECMAVRRRDIADDDYKTNELNKSSQKNSDLAPSKNSASALQSSPIENIKKEQAPVKDFNNVGGTKKTTPDPALTGSQGNPAPTPGANMGGTVPSGQAAPSPEPAVNQGNPPPPSSASVGKTAKMQPVGQTLADQLQKKKGNLNKLNPEDKITYENPFDDVKGNFRAANYSVEMLKTDVKIIENVKGDRQEFIGQIVNAMEKRMFQDKISENEEATVNEIIEELKVLQTKTGDEFKKSLGEIQKKVESLVGEQVSIEEEEEWND